MYECNACVFAVDGMSVEHDQRLIELVKKQLMSLRLSDSLTSVVRLLTVSG